MFLLDASLAAKVISDITKALPWVTNVKFDEGTTPDGASALIVYLVAPAKAKELRDGAKLSDAANLVLRTFSKHRIAMWPFVRFMSSDDAVLAAT